MEFAGEVIFIQTISMRFLLFSLAIAIAGCRNSASKAPVQSPDSITKDMVSYLAYNRDQVDLWASLEAVDTAGNPVSKRDFLTALRTGKYLPLRLGPGRRQAYRLHPLSPETDPGIGEAVAQFAEREQAYFLKEGQPLPPFTTTDLRGNRVDQATHLGRVVVMKCWFINCVPCVAEMPEFNALIKRYAPRKDLVFLGLALDEKTALDRFLQKRELHCPVLPDQDALIEQLGVSAFPTHVIVDRKGKIARYLNSVQDLEEALPELLSSQKDRL